MVKLLEKLGLEETREVPDPFGMGITYEIRHINHPLYKAHVKEKGEAPLIKTLQAKATKAMALAGALSRGDDEKAGREFERLLERYIDEIPDEDINLSEQDLEGIALLVAGWDGDDEPYSPEAVAALLKAENPIPVEIQEDDFSVNAGTAVGAAMALWFVYQARQLERFRDSAMEAIEGN
jgi:hypothetical protein